MKKLSDYTGEEIDELCKKYNLYDYTLSYTGCSIECPFHCPEPDACVVDDVLRDKKVENNERV